MLGISIPGVSSVDIGLVELGAVSGLAKGLTTRTTTPFPVVLEKPRQCVLGSKSLEVEGILIPPLKGAGVTDF